MRASPPDIEADLAAFRAKFHLDTLTLEAQGGWVLSLRPGQLTLGAMVLSLASGTQDLAGLSAAEGAGLATGLGRAERLARQHLGAVRINALCLMMQDPVVHFHILPRFDAPRIHLGHRWEDANWPGPVQIAPLSTSMETLEALKRDMMPVLNRLGP